MIEVLVDILLIPVIYWTVFSFFIVSTIYLSEDDSLMPSVSFFIGTIGLGILKFGSFSYLFEFVKENPSTIIVLVIFYLIIGIIWSLFKWYLFIKDKVKVRPDLNASKYDLKVDYNKEKIITWIIVWVPSMAWFLVNDPIRRVGNFIYDRLHSTYKSMADKIIRFEK